MPDRAQLERADATIRAWIEVTKLGVVARVDGEQVSSWVEDIAPDRSLAPIAGATTSLLVSGRTDMPAPATTDAAGHTTFELPAYVPPPTLHNAQDDTGAPADERTALLVVQRGTDSAFATIDRHEKTLRERDAYWYVTDDRFTYRPGEPVYVKGWVRWSDNGVNPHLELPAATDDIAYTLYDSRNNKVATGTAHVTDQGGFDLQTTIPPTAGLGTARFTFETKHQTFDHPIEIQEFRTPTYAVTLNDDVMHRGAVPLVLGESIEMSAAAKYYAGGGLADAKIRWDGLLSAVVYDPPGWDRFSFTPAHARSDDGRPYLSANAQQDATLSGSSSSSVVIGISALPAQGPSVLEVDATVTDLDRASIRASSRPILVHPSSYYVGLHAQPETRRRSTRCWSSRTSTVTRCRVCRSTSRSRASSPPRRYRDDAKVIDIAALCGHERERAGAVSLDAGRRADVVSRRRTDRRCTRAHERRAVRAPASADHRVHPEPVDRSRSRVVSAGADREADDPFVDDARDRGGVVRAPGADRAAASRALDGSDGGRAADRALVRPERARAGRSLGACPRSRQHEHVADPQHTTAELDLPIELEQALGS